MIQLFLVLLLSQPVFTHEFKMSVCEIQQEGTTSNLSVKFYLFQDDLKEAVYGDPESNVFEEETIIAYVVEKVRISTNGKVNKLIFSKIEKVEDQVKLTFNTEMKSSSSPNELKVNNQLLIEKFRQQTNMVYFTKTDGSKKTLILNKGKTIGKFTL